MGCQRKAAPQKRRTEKKGCEYAEDAGADATQRRGELRGLKAEPQNEPRDLHPLHPPQSFGGRAQYCYGGRVGCDGVLKQVSRFEGEKPKPVGIQRQGAKRPRRKVDAARFERMGWPLALTKW
jgi:hypothetical protein